MATKKKLLQAAAGQAGGEALNVEDVFSTYLFTPNTSGNFSVTNNIDLDGEGGLVWLKQRDVSANHLLYDTNRGASAGRLASNLTNSEALAGVYFDAFNSDGFTVKDMNNDEMASWTFRKAPKFFDVVTYTGDGVAGRSVSHDLNSDVGFLIVKRTDTTSSWYCWHNSGTTTNGYIELDQGSSYSTYTGLWNNTSPTSTAFTLGSDNVVNASGGTYVAYLFAHNDGDGEFGPDGDLDAIKCGTYAGNGTDKRVIDLGFEAQWLLVKRSDGASDWHLFDNMRGLPVRGGSSTFLEANTSNAEATTGQLFGHNQGFMVDAGDFNSSGEDYIYMAIRRGPLAQPESGTEVFALQQDNAPDNNAPAFRSSFPVDAAFSRNAAATAVNFLGSRLTGANYLRTNDTNAEAANTDFAWDYMNGWNSEPAQGSSVISYMWKRAPGFFDVVAYTGVSGVQTINHNLAAVPEMIWIKKRSEVSYYGFVVYHGTTGNMYLSNNFSSGFGGSNAVIHSTISDTTFQVANGNIDVNDVGETHIAYLFATVPGVSKVGSYTGNGTSQTIDCGFTSGARFVLIKRTDSPDDWIVVDTVRGIVSGNDPYLALNTTDPQGTSQDYVDPHSSGFIVTGENPVGASGGSYIFYAIA